MNYLFGIIPIPSPLRSHSLVYDLKTRLDWGEPGLTIVDVRDRTAFNRSHISGAISMPLPELVERARRSLPLNRDIYLYSDTDEETAEAANQLRLAGYRNISEVRGGLAAWKAVGFPIEAIGFAVI
jgi:rhodanese-related sulfurtransferase